MPLIEIFGKPPHLFAGSPALPVVTEVESTRPSSPESYTTYTTVVGSDPTLGPESGSGQTSKTTLNLIDNGPSQPTYEKPASGYPLLYLSPDTTGSPKGSTPPDSGTPSMLLDMRDASMNEAAAVRTHQPTAPILLRAIPSNDAKIILARSEIVNETNVAQSANPLQYTSLPEQPFVSSDSTLDPESSRPRQATTFTPSLAHRPSSTPAKTPVQKPDPPNVVKEETQSRRNGVDMGGLSRIQGQKPGNMAPVKPVAAKKGWFTKLKDWALS